MTEGEKLLHDLRELARKMACDASPLAVITRVRVRALSELEHIPRAAPMRLAMDVGYLGIEIVCSPHVPVNRAWIEFTGGRIEVVKIREGEP